MSNKLELKVLKAREEVAQQTIGLSSLCTSACFSSISSVDTDGGDVTDDEPTEGAEMSPEVRAAMFDELSE